MILCSVRSRRWLWAVALSAVVAGALVALVVLQPWDPQDPAALLDRKYRRAAVAANGYECASIGKEILQKNGSAVDAAIATLFCEGVACAQCMGLGGGFLATIYDASSGHVRVLNARERAPLAASANMFDTASSTVGGLAVAVPGELRGYGEMHRVYGRLPWADLVLPTIELCKKGHRVNEYMARVLKTYSDRIKAEPTMAELYVNSDTGEVWNEGDSIVEPTLARTLTVIATEGPEAIHNGSLTAALARDVQALGGILTEDDLKKFKVEWQDPIPIALSEEFTMYSPPLPGSGSVLAFILNMLRDWVGPSDGNLDRVGLYWHRVVEAFKFAYAKRTGLGDPSRFDVPYNIRELELNMSNAAWAEQFRAMVDDNKTSPDWQHYGAMFGGTDNHGTAHIVVIAPDGSAVSATSTVNYIWGSQRRSTSLGILLNNEMDDFAVPNRASAYGMPPSPANIVSPGRQPLSSMVPSIVLNKNNSVELVIGAAGGTKITTQVALATRGALIEGDTLKDLVRKPRLHHQLMPMEIEHEADFDSTILASLRARGHALTERGPLTGFAALVVARREADGYSAQTDRRRVGSIDGI